MSVQNYIGYTWGFTPSASIRLTRTVVGAVPGGLDLAVPNGAQNTPAAVSLLRAKAQSVFLFSDQPVTLKAGGVNAVQQVAVTGGPTGGTFTLSFGGQTTAGIPYNATAAQVAAALNLLSTVGAGGVTATGGPLPGTPVAVTFGGLNAVQVVALMTANGAGLTGGTGPAVAVTTTTAGAGPDTTINLVANVPYVYDAAGYAPILFAADVAALYITNASGATANVKLRTLSNA